MLNKSEVKVSRYSVLSCNTKDYVQLVMKSTSATLEQQVPVGAFSSVK